MKQEIDQMIPPSSRIVSLSFSEEGRRDFFLLICSKAAWTGRLEDEIKRQEKESSRNRKSKVTRSKEDLLAHKKMWKRMTEEEDMRWEDEEQARIQEENDENLKRII